MNYAPGEGQGGGWNQHPQHQQGWGPPTGPPVKTYLVESIISLMFCGGLFAIPALIYASQVDSKLKSGDYQGAVEASRNAKKWLIIGIAVACGIIALAFIGIGVLTALQASS